MRMRRLLGAVGGALLVVGLAACGGGGSSGKADAGPGTELNPFFNPYKHALFLTGQAEVGPAAAALDSAMTAFKHLVEHPPESWKEDPGWPERREAMGASLVAADTLLQHGRTADSHEALEAVRYQLRDQNRAAGLDGWPDELLAFHDPMEEMVMAGDAEAMEDAVPTVREALKDLESFADPSWTDADRARKQQAMSLFAAQLDSVAAALREGGSLEAAHPHAVRIKQAFVKLYLGSTY